VSGPVAQRDPPVHRPKAALPAPPWLFGPVLALVILSAAGIARAGCGPDAAPCDLAGGSYEIELPDGASAPTASPPSVMFVHGHGSSGEGTMKNRGMVDALLARGYAVIAPSGSAMAGRDGRYWSFRPGAVRADRPAARDDIAFLAAVRDDAATRFGLDRGRMLLAGFSVGGSMVSYLACATPDAFAAYAPVSGGFWRPHPEGCAGPVRLLHTHGWTDATVPLEGRILRSAGADGQAIAQGDIFATMEIWRAANGCTALRADAFVTEGPFWRRSWTRCSPGTALELALFPGDHRIPLGWSDMALDWFEALPPR
jgi:polyhydroxybutyrate depolymerase